MDGHHQWDNSYTQATNYQGYTIRGGGVAPPPHPYPPPYDTTDPSMHDQPMAYHHQQQQDIYQGPSPVMLSSPYSKNAAFASGQPLDPSQMSSSSSATQGSSAGSTPVTKRSSAHRSNSSPYRQPPARAARKHQHQQRKSESDDADQSPPATKPRTGRGKKPPHELLTEAEKKANHIASEQKRRQNIRVGFDQLVEIVPTLSQSHRSEALILQKSVDHIHKLVAAKNDLKERVRELQSVLGELPPDDDSSEDEINYSY